MGVSPELKEKLSLLLKLNTLPELSMYKFSINPGSANNLIIDNALKLSSIRNSKYIIKPDYAMSSNTFKLKYLPF